MFATGEEIAKDGQRRGADCESISEGNDMARLFEWVFMMFFYRYKMI
jgi:hypothetical protein